MNELILAIILLKYVRAVHSLNVKVEHQRVFPQEYRKNKETKIRKAPAGPAVAKVAPSSLFVSLLPSLYPLTF